MTAPDRETPVYLGWPMHSQAASTQLARLSLALRLELTPPLLRVAGRLGRVLGWADRVRARVNRLLDRLQGKRGSL